MAREAGRFEGQTAIVTGGGYGIGEAIALALAAEGARVALAARSRERLEGVAARIAAAGGEAEVILTDVADEASVEAMTARTLERFGRIDVLVNNAGIAGPTKLATDIAAVEWRETIEVNLTGAFYCAKHAAREMIRAGRGAIVNISSVGGRIGYPHRTPYAASKWGMIGLSHSLAAELGGKGIRVNVVCPGPVEGDRIDAVLAERAKRSGGSLEKARAKAVSGVPLGRMVTADEVARAVLFFACERDCAGVTGQVLNVDGGMRMQ